MARIRPTRSFPNMLSLPPSESKVVSKYVALGRKTSNSKSSKKKIFPDGLPVPSTWSCFCPGSVETRDEIERRPLFMQKSEEAGNGMMATKVKLEIVMLRVSMHCNGCAKKVEKQVSKIEGVSCYKVDLESKMVVIIGDAVPVEVLERVSMIKRAEFWG